MEIHLISAAIIRELCGIISSHCDNLRLIDFIGKVM